MIRLFTELSKSILETFTDEELFLRAAGAFNHYGAKCPDCGVSGWLSPYGAYGRGLVSFENDQVVDHRVNTPRLKCPSCRATHALLPDILTPRSPYSLRFKLSALLAYFERKMTVAAICEGFGIAVSTLYRWKECFLSHKGLLLGALIDRKEPAPAFLYGLLESGRVSDTLRDFFHRHLFSFLQNRSTPPTMSAPP